MFRAEFSIDFQLKTISVAKLFGILFNLSLILRIYLIFKLNLICYLVFAL